jgi:CHAT domain-containing protein/tetratricopeptide (TPR) repeat protein
VTGESWNAPPAGAHPDPQQIAAHADGRLSASEATRMDEHIAACALCYEVFAETVQFGLTEPEAPAATLARPRAAPFAFVRNRTFRIAAALAATVVIGVGVARWVKGPATLVAQLAQAIGPRRFVEPRLTGGFAYGRLIVLRSEAGAPGLDAQSPAVLAAVAQIRQKAEGDTSPDALGALAVTYLVSGDVAAAVKSLESATAQAPDDARLLSDLAAAYLVRAERSDEPADIPKALELAERAIALPNAPVEVYFNRALALERLHLGDAARKAWEDYLQRDPASGWADEARQHLEALASKRQSSAEEDKARVRAALEAGAAAIDRLAEESPSPLREYFENELLPAWADAYLVGHPDAALHRERARLVGDALLRTTTDAMPRDAARALSEPAASATSRDPLRSEATGYQIMREAQRLESLREPSCEPYRDAARHLSAGGSAYAVWAAQQVVSACLVDSEPDEALPQLEQLTKLVEPLGYVQALGHVRWLQGLVHGRRGDLTESLELYHAARACFETSRDVESAATIDALTAENLHLLGEERSAWRDHRRALAQLSHVSNPRRRQRILAEAVFACLEGRMPRAALQLQTVLVGWESLPAHPWDTGEALTVRAAIHHALGRDDLATLDLREARRWTTRIADKALAELLQAQIEMTEGEVLVQTQPEAAVVALERSLTHLGATRPALLPGLRLMLARAQTARGFDDVAERELSVGIEALEHTRISLRDAALQVSFFDRALPLFDDMVRLQVTKRHDPERALAFVERGHARQLIDSMAGVVASPLDPDVLQRELPEGLAIIYYVSLEDRLFAWALSRENCDFIERPLPAAELSKLVAAYRSAIEGRASQEAMRLTSGRLHDELVRPLLPFIGQQRALAFVPDGILQTVAFAGLWNRQTGRYLIEDSSIVITPSGTVFVHASAGSVARHTLAVRALVVGNPQLDRGGWLGLPNLPAAEAEAREIAHLYPGSLLLTGVGATKSAFLDRADSSQVVHYAGHAAVSADAISTARLLLAPDPRTGDSGALYLHDLGSQGFPRTRVVVLAACRTAAGTVSRVEGAFGLGQPFLAAGVPHVIASLWDIDDSVSRRFFLAFHRALLTEGDPVLALRTTQIALLRSGDSSLAHPASWAAFISMGGIDPHSFNSFTKGDMS